MDDSGTENGEKPPGWPLGEHLLSKGYELAFEDTGMAIRFARLGLRLSALLEGGYDPFAPPAKPGQGGQDKGRKKRS